MVRKRDGQNLSLFAWQTSDTCAIVAVDVEALATGARMRSDDWVLDGRITLGRSCVCRFIDCGSASKAAAALAKAVSPSVSPCSSGTSMAYSIVARGGRAEYIMSLCQFSPARREPIGLPSLVMLEIL